MWQIFRVQGGTLARNLWWEDDAEDSASLAAASFGPRAYQSTNASPGVVLAGGGGGGGDVEEWEIRRDRSDARHCLRQLVGEAMALADFFAKGNPRGKVRTGGESNRPTDATLRLVSAVRFLLACLSLGFIFLCPRLDHNWFFFLVWCPLVRSLHV